MSTKKKRNSGTSSGLPLAWQNTKEVATLQHPFDAVDSNFRTDRYPIDPRFRWITMENRVMKVQEMATPHLYNSLKMIWNHTVPIPFRLMPYKPYECKKASWYKCKKMGRWAISNLFNELMNRNDRPLWVDLGLSKMAEHLTSNEHLRLL